MQMMRAVGWQQQQQPGEDQDDRAVALDWLAAAMAAANGHNLASTRWRVGVMTISRYRYYTGVV